VTGLNSVPEVMVSGRSYRTMAADIQSTYELHPTVTDSGNDAGVDGQVTVPPAMPITSVTANSAEPFYLLHVDAPAGADIGQFVLDVHPAGVAAVGNEAAVALLEDAFQNLEQLALLVRETAIGQPGAVLQSEESESLSSAQHDLALLQAADASPHDWLSADYLTFLGRSTRRGQLNAARELLDADNAGDDASALDAFFANEGGRASDNR